MSVGFGDIAAAMFEERAVTMRAYEWAEILRALHAAPGGSETRAFTSLAAAFNTQRV